MLRRVSHQARLSAQCLHQSRRQLSSDQQRKSENAALLRATRKSRTTPADKPTVNYRYRQGQESSSSIASLWGAADDDTVKFVPFFDQVDAHIADKRRGGANGAGININQKSKNSKSTLDTLFDELDSADKATQQQQQQQQQQQRLILSDAVTGQRRSILDAFPIPAAPPRRSPNAFDEESCRQYKQVLQDKITKKGKIARSVVISDWLQSEEKLIDYHLPALDRAVKEGAVSDPDDLEFRDDLEKQRMAFMMTLKINDDEYREALDVLVRVGRACAKQAKSLPLNVAWEKIKEGGFITNNDSLSNFLYVSSTYGTRPFAAGPMGSILDILDPINRENSHDTNDTGTIEPEEESEVDVAEEIAAFHDNLYAPSEQSLAVRVKAMVRKGNAKAAETLLEHSTLKNLRLRAYQPILKLYLDRGDVSSAMSLFKRMRETPSVILEAETYVQLIAAVAENGFFCTDAPPIEGCLELGFDPPSGPALLDQLVSALAEDFLEITPALAKRLHTAMIKAFKNTEIGRNLEELHPLAPLQQDNETGRPGDVLASRVEIDTNTGICPKSGARLRLITLDQQQRHKLKGGLLELADTQFKRFHKNKPLQKKPRDNDRPPVNPQEQMNVFLAWLDKRKGKPYTAIIDGANVAFYLQNFDAGKFNFYQIKFMVEALERMNETPLVVLPFKYCRPYFHVMRGNGFQKQVVNYEEQSILSDLRNAGKLYVTPPNCQDDHFWMLASISDQAESLRGRSQDVLPGDPQGRWPGTRPMLISNDQMRDHKLELVEPRLFRRWYSSHIVNYNFTGFVNGECVDDEIGFSPADFFSREIQENKAVVGDSTGEDGSVAWHFPVSDWKESERFCLRVPTKHR